MPYQPISDSTQTLAAYLCRCVLNWPEIFCTTHRAVNTPHNPFPSLLSIVLFNAPNKLARIYEMNFVVDRCSPSDPGGRKHRVPSHQRFKILSPITNARAYLLFLQAFLQSWDRNWTLPLQTFTTHKWWKECPETQPAEQLPTNTAADMDHQQTSAKLNFSHIFQSVWNHAVKTVVLIQPSDLTRITTPEFTAPKGGSSSPSGTKCIADQQPRKQNLHIALVHGHRSRHEICDIKSGIIVRCAPTSTCVDFPFYPEPSHSSRSTPYFVPSPHLYVTFYD